MPHVSQPAAFEAPCVSLKARRILIIESCPCRPRTRWTFRPSTSTIRKNGWLSIYRPDKSVRHRRPEGLHQIQGQRGPIPVNLMQESNCRIQAMCRQQRRQLVQQQPQRRGPEGVSGVRLGWKPRDCYACQGSERQELLREISVCRFASQRVASLSLDERCPGNFRVVIGMPVFSRPIGNPQKLLRCRLRCVLKPLAGLCCLSLAAHLELEQSFESLCSEYDARPNLPWKPVGKSTKRSLHSLCRLSGCQQRQNVIVRPQLRICACVDLRNTCVFAVFIAHSLAPCFHTGLA